LTTEWKKKIRHWCWIVDFDARIDSDAFSSAKGAREPMPVLEFMDRFHVGGGNAGSSSNRVEAATIGLRPAC